MILLAIRNYVMHQSANQAGSLAFSSVLALFPLALHGGPLWEALCYAQIGGLSLATLVTLFIVPVIYSIFVLDLKVIKWREG